MTAKEKDGVFSVDLEWAERQDLRSDHNYKSFELASTETPSSTSRGTSSGTFYSLEPVKWLKQMMEAAKEKMVIQPLSRQEVLPAGTAQLWIPLETVKFPASSWETSAEEYSAANTDILFTDITTYDGVLYDPVDESYAIGVSNKALRRNALNLMEKYQKELEYRMSYVIDNKLLLAMNPSGTDGDGTGIVCTEMSNSARGVQTILGGDATTTADSLDAGDVFTTVMIKKMNRLLQSKKGYYWTGNTWTASATAKNPWQNDADGPFYCLVKPESEEALLNSSQFTNAAEFGNDSVIKNGFIANYAGIRFAKTTMTSSWTSAQNVYISGATSSLDIAAHDVFMFKANYATGLVWGQKPKFYAFDFPSKLQKRIVVEMAYKALPLYNDAIVRAVVADE